MADVIIFLGISLGKENEKAKKTPKKKATKKAKSKKKFYIFITFMENILTFDEKIIKYIHDVTKILKN